MNKLIAVSFSALFITGLVACNATKKAAKGDESKKTGATTTSTVVVPVIEPVKTLPSGLEYQIQKHGTGTRKPVLNDRIEMALIVRMEDTVIFDSHKMNNNKPVPLQVGKAKFKGDPVEGYMLLTEGDSAVFRLPVDTLMKSGNQMPPWMKEGKKLEYDVVMMSIRSDSEVKREAEQKLVMQKAIDDSLMNVYFAKNNLHPTKTASGMYYIIKQEGTGEKARPGNVLSMFYTGKFLNGIVFDTNQDSTFHHQDPLKVELGKGKVIKGWDEGLALLNKGSIATLFIPSYLAYGPKERGPIAANSVLMFDVNVKNIQTQEEIDDIALQDYFTQNKIKALKTPSGLYYTIKKKGKGKNAVAGQTVTVKYTGKTIDGKTFDSNTDTTFHHAEPFKFELGKGRVIKGWDEGIALLNKGANATLYIPSMLGYGPQGQGRKIPPNSILIFDVALEDFSSPGGAEDKSSSPHK